MVKAMKDMLYSTIGNRLVDVDVSATKITEASGIINSRPPTYIGKNDYSTTPEQLLKGGFTNKTLDSMEPDVPDEIDEQNAHVNAREQARRKFVAEYWTAFNTLFLNKFCLFHVEMKSN
jgi:hypothetical protein